MNRWQYLLRESSGSGKMRQSHNRLGEDKDGQATDFTEESGGLAEHRYQAEPPRYLCLWLVALQVISLLACSFAIHTSPAYAAECDPPCSAGQECQSVRIGLNNTASVCVGEPDPAPELSVMMLPVALGAAGVLAIRARRRACRNPGGKRLSGAAPDTEERL